MKRIIEGDGRTQSTLFPASLDEYVDENNPVRVIDAFVDALDLGELDFKGVVPEATGRPSYHPSMLLKIYVYGYLNRIASSRRLERETQRNVEMMWLTGRLMPDFKTIANFRKENAKALRRVCREFVVLCRNLDLFADALVANRGYFEGEQLRACDDAGITIFVPRPLRSGSKAKGRFGKQDFVYLPDENAYRCPAGEHLTWRYKSVEDGKTMHSYWTTACTTCLLKEQCTTGKERRVKRWEHEAVLEVAQRRLDLDPEKMAVRRCTAEHPFGTLKSWMGAAHFLTRTKDRVNAEMSLHVLAYNIKRMIKIMGIGPLLEAIRADGEALAAFLELVSASIGQYRRFFVILLIIRTSSPVSSS